MGLIPTSATALFMLVGQKHQGKTSIASGAFERAILFGRRVDQTIATTTNGFQIAHIEDVMKEWFDELTVKSRKRDPNWQPPSKSGYTLDAYNFILGEFAKPKWDEIRAQYDCVILDEFTAVMDESHQRAIEEAEAHYRKAQRTPILELDNLKRHRFCNSKHKPDLQKIFGLENVAVPRLANKLSNLDLSGIIICHTRESETKNGNYRKAHPQMTSRNVEKKSIRPAQEIYFLDQHPDFMDGFSTEGRPYAPRFIAQMNHPDYKCSTKAGIIPGTGPGNLWAVVKLMGLRQRRQEGRERMDDAVAWAKSEIVSKGLWDAKAAARHVYYAMKGKSLDWAFMGSKTQAIRVVYQQAYAWAWYEREQDRDPFSDDSFLTDTADEATSSVSGAGANASWD